MAPSRRSVLTLIGSVLLASPLAPRAIEASPQAAELIFHNGWILRPDDLTRLGRR